MILRAAKPSSKFVRMVLSCLLLIIFSFFFGVHRHIRHAWISLNWPQAEGEIFEVLPPGAWSSGLWAAKGYPFPATIMVRTTNGQQFPGHLIEPLRSSYLSLEGMPKQTISRPPPRPGDRIIVHLHPAADGRVMPRDNLTNGAGAGVMYFWLAIILFVDYLLRRFKLRWR